MSAERQIKLGSILAYASIALNVVTGLLYTPWMIQSIGKADYGLFTLAMSVISLFVFDFGLGSAVTRFLSKYLAQNEQTKANNFMSIVYRLYLYIDVLLFILLLSVYFLIPYLYQHLSLEEIEKFKVVYAIAAVFSIFSFPFIPLNGCLIAYEKFIQNKLCDLLHKILVVGLMIYCLYLGYGLYALVMVNAIAGLLTITMKLWCLNRYTKQRTNWTYNNKEDYREIASYSGWVTVKSLAQRCIMNIAPSILGILSGSIEIAILGIAITLEGYTYMFSSAISGMFLPKVSREIANGHDILPLMIKVGRIQIYVVGFIVTGFFLYGGEFIHFWVGDSFADSYKCASMMILPSFIHLPQEIAHQTIYVHNKVKLEAKVFCLMALVNILLAFALAPLWGAKGIGLSICIAYLVRTLGMDYIYIKYLKIDIISFVKMSYVKMFFPFLALLIFGIFVNMFVHEMSILILLVKLIVFTFAYFSVFYVFVMNKFEKDLMKGALKAISR